MGVDWVVRNATEFVEAGFRCGYNHAAKDMAGGNVSKSTADKTQVLETGRREQLADLVHELWWHTVETHYLEN